MSLLNGEIRTAARKERSMAVLCQGLMNTLAHAKAEQLSQPSVDIEASPFVHKWLLLLSSAAEPSPCHGSRPLPFTLYRGSIVWALVTFSAWLLTATSHLSNLPPLVSTHKHPMDQDPLTPLSILRSTSLLQISFSFPFSRLQDAFDFVAIPPFEIRTC